MDGVVAKDFGADIVVKFDDGPMLAQLLEPLVTIVIMLEPFLQERLCKLDADGLILDSEEAIVQLDAGSHHVEWVRDTHCSLNA